MKQSGQSTPSFAQRLRNGDVLRGTFIKVPTVYTTELIGSVGFDFIVIDQEHAPFDRVAIDNVILASRAMGISALVRIGDPSASNILSILDCGATGVMVPHVESVDAARSAVAACRYRSGRRGFSRTGRAGGYGAAPIDRHITTQDSETLCIAMIEDVAAIENAEAIASVAGIDAVFIGRGDLSIAMGESATDAPAVQDAVRTIAAGVKRTNKPLLYVAESQADHTVMTDLGGTAFMIGSDLAFLRRAAIQALADYL